MGTSRGEQIVAIARAIVKTEADHTLLCHYWVAVVAGVFFSNRRQRRVGSDYGVRVRATRNPE